MMTRAAARSSSVRARENAPIGYSIQAPKAQCLTGMVLSDVCVNVLRKLGGLVAIGTLVLGRHAALVAQVPRHVLLQGEAAVAARTVVTLVHGVHFAPSPGGVLAST